MIVAIWEEAMCLSVHQDTVMDRYFDLFQDYEDPNDTYLAMETVSRHAIVKIWKRLRLRFPESFFYSDEDGNESTTMSQVITIARLDGFTLIIGAESYHRERSPHAPLQAEDDLVEASQKLFTG